MAWSDKARAAAAAARRRKTKGLTTSQARRKDLFMRARIESRVNQVYKREPVSKLKKLLGSAALNVVARTATGRSPIKKAAKREARANAPFSNMSKHSRAVANINWRVASTPGKYLTDRAVVRRMGAASYVRKHFKI